MRSSIAALLLAALSVTATAHAGKGYREAQATAERKAAKPGLAPVMHGDKMFAHDGVFPNTITVRTRTGGTGLVGKYMRRSFVTVGGEVRYDGTHGELAGRGIHYEPFTRVLAREQKDGSWLVQKRSTNGQDGRFGKAYRVGPQAMEMLRDGLIPMP